MARSRRYIKRTNSNSPLRSYSINKSQQTVFPNFSLAAAVNAVDNDSVARGALKHFVDKCMEGDISVLRKDTKELDQNFEEVLNSKYIFRTKVLRSIFLQAKLFNNVFVEIVRGSENKVIGLNVLDAMNVEPITLPNGDPMPEGAAYKSKTQDPRTGMYPTWEKSEIVWLKFDDRSVGWAPVDFKSIWEILKTKEYVRRYVAWLWETGQYRIHYNFKSGAADADIADFLVYAKKHDGDFQVPFLTKGDLDIKQHRDMQETDSIDVLLKYLDNQLLIALRVPPIDAGLPETSGRSNADAQSNNFHTHVTSYKKVVEDMVNYELFPKMNKGNNMIRFGPVDRFAFTQVVDNIVKMKSAGMKPEVIKEYMANCGIVYNESDYFVEAPDMTGAPQMQSEGSPSRIRGKTQGESDNNVGTGQQSSTRDEQLRKTE